jgi:hypothetical protein
MAALTQDLDTQVITTKIKEALLANNIGQKVSAILLVTCKYEFVPVHAMKAYW